MTQEKITVSARIEAPIEKVWEYYNDPVHVVKWNAASPDWHTPRAENDLVEGGTFLYRMEAKDGSEGFDFGGVYSRVEEYKSINYRLGDEREVEVTFSEEEGGTRLEIEFDAEAQNPAEMQKAGWQAILDNFMRYVESTE